MRTLRFVSWIAAAILALGLAPATAQTFDAGSLGIDEIRIGPEISGLELIPNTGVVPQLSSFSLSNIDGFQFDILFRNPAPDVFYWIGTPRPTIGGIVSLRGRESLIHSSLTWHIPILDTPFYIETAAGFGIHNGALEGAAPPLRNLGCRMLYHWSAGIGANLDDNWTITAELQHMSNVIANCVPNDGLNHFGITVGYKF
jgi:lipid A 3-O-deacylase